MKLDINEAMTQLATAFNTTVDKLYPMLIKQAYVSGILNLIMAVFFLAILIVVPIVIYKKWATIYKADLEFPVLFGLVIYAVIAVFLIPVGVSDGVTALINPEYWALKEVISALNPSE